MGRLPRRSQQGPSPPQTLAPGDRPLLALRVAPGTADKYRAGVLRLYNYMAAVDTTFSNYDELDDILCDYIHYLWCEDPFNSGQLQRASHAIFGLELFEPRAKGHLLASRSALRGWERLLPSQSPPAMSRDIALAIAVDLWRTNNHDAAILVLLSHDCYLRANEALGLRVQDFAAGHTDPLVPALSPELGIAGISLGHTKTGRNQFVTIRDVLVRDLLRRLVQDKAPADRIFNLNYNTYRRQFNDSLARLGINNLGFVLHSLRHGGATFDFLQNRDLHYIFHRGRWLQFNSARRYIEAGAALLARLSLPPLATQAIASAKVRTFSWFDLPSPVSRVR